MLVFPTVEPKIAIESRIPKELPKIPTLFPEAGSKMLRKIVQSCSPKLLPKLCPKAILQNYCPQAAIPQICSPKWPPKAILQRSSRKLRPKIATAAPQSGPKLLPQSCGFSILYLKMASQSFSQSCLWNCPRKLLFSKTIILKIITEKLLPKAIPPIIIPKAAMVPKANYLHLCGIALEFWR